MSEHRIVLGLDVTICQRCVGLCAEILAEGYPAADVSVLARPACSH